MAALWGVYMALCNIVDASNEHKKHWTGCETEVFFLGGGAVIDHCQFINWNNNAESLHEGGNGYIIVLCAFDLPGIFADWSLDGRGKGSCMPFVPGLQFR